jgi:hypothetical protein
MDVGATFVTDGESAEAMKPCEGPFDDPSVAPETFSGFDTTPSDSIDDAPKSTRETATVVIVGFVGVEFGRALARTASRRRRRAHLVEQRHEHHRIVQVGRRQLDRERHAFFVNDQMVLATGASPIRRIRPNFAAPFFAGMLEASNAVRDQSMCPRLPRSSRSTWCSSSHTPARCQSRSRRQHVIPLPQPISCGSICQGIPVISTNRIPVSAARSSRRGRPPSGFSGSLGKMGSIRFHSSSDTRGLAMEVPLTGTAFHGPSFVTCS